MAPLSGDFTSMFPAAFFRWLRRLPWILLVLTMSAYAEAPIADRISVIAHRGASATFPEHTLEAYRQAIADGADFIEPDLVMSSDGVLIARHENEIGGTTDVAAHPEFAARRTCRRVNGRRVEGWFSEDFTLAELKTLRVRERLPGIRGTAHDGQSRILTLEEIIDLIAAESAARGRVVGLIPEIKYSSYFRERGLAMEEPLLELLRTHRYTRMAPIVIQSFEISNLQALRGWLNGDDGNIRLMQLIGRRGQRPVGQARDGRQRRYGDMLTPRGLREIAAYADILGPEIRTVIPLTFTRRLGRPSALVGDAHAAGLEVQPYTFRPENRYLAREFRSNGPRNQRHEAGSIAEIRAYLDTGIDGFFTDDPALGRRAVDALR